MGDCFDGFDFEGEGAFLVAEEAVKPFVLVTCVHIRVVEAKIPSVHDAESSHVLQIQFAGVFLLFATVCGFQRTPGDVETFGSGVGEIVPVDFSQRAGPTHFLVQYE